MRVLQERRRETNKVSKCSKLKLHSTGKGSASPPCGATTDASMQGAAGEHDAEDDGCEPTAGAPAVRERGGGEGVEEMDTEEEEEVDVEEEEEREDDDEEAAEEEEFADFALEGRAGLEDDEEEREGEVGAEGTFSSSSVDPLKAVRSCSRAP